MSASPTSRTLQECKKRGWWAAVVEKWIAQTGIRQDVWGFGDILALDEKPGALLIQATTVAHGANRVTKIETKCAAAATAWLKAENRIEVWGWSKRQVGRRRLWALKVYPVTLETLKERAA